MKKIPLFCLLLLSALSFLQAQPLYFTQPSAAILNFNPAFAGSLKDARLITTARKDYISRQPVGTTAYASYDHLSHRLRGGVGLEASLWTNNQLYISSLAGIYSGKIHLGGQWSLSTAAKVRLNFLDRKYKSPQNEHAQRLYLYFMPALLLNSTNFYFGVSADNLPAIQLYSLGSASAILTDPTLYMIAQAGYSYTSYENAPWAFAISGIGQLSRGNILVQPQVMFRYKPILFGGGIGLSLSKTSGNTLKYIRNFLAVGYKYEHFRILLNYDLGRMAQPQYVPRSLELTLAFYLSRNIPSASSTASLF